MDEGDVVDVIERAGLQQLDLAQHPLHFLDAGFGQHHLALLLVLLVFLRR